MSRMQEVMNELGISGGIDVSQRIVSAPADMPSGTTERTPIDTVARKAGRGY